MPSTEQLAYIEDRLRQIYDQLLAANWIALGEVGKAIELMTK